MSGPFEPVIRDALEHVRSLADLRKRAMLLQHVLNSQLISNTLASLADLGGDPAGLTRILEDRYYIAPLCELKLPVPIKKKIVQHLASQKTALHKAALMPSRAQQGGVRRSLGASRRGR